MVLSKEVPGAGDAVEAKVHTSRKEHIIESKK